MMSLLAWILLPLAVLAVDDGPIRTIIDVLSSSPEFSEILKLIQHRGILPLINESYNSTFLAPVNTAFIGVDVAEISTDQLLYHFVNATVVSSDLANVDGGKIYKTYLDNGNAPISLDLEDGINDQVDFVDLDMFASFDRGVVHSVGSLVEIPGTMSQKLYTSNKLQNFANLLNQGSEFNNGLIFVPRNDAIESWLSEAGDRSSSSVILNYLGSPFGESERRDFLHRHIVLDFDLNSNVAQEVRMQDGTQVTLHPNMSISGSDFNVKAVSDVKVARNGIYVEVDSVAACDPMQFLDLTKEKFILGLGGYALVRTLHLYGHQHLIDGSKKYNESEVIIVPVTETETIMPDVYRQHNISIIRSVDSDSEMDIDWETVVLDYGIQTVDPSTVALYQFLNDKLPVKKNHTLLSSRMKLRSGLYPQRVHFDRHSQGQVTLNWEYLNGAQYILGNTTFYISHDLLPTPSGLTLVLGPMLTSSYSFNFLEKLGLLQLPVQTSWTLFIPTREAWERNWLLMLYLDKNDKALKEVFANLVYKVPVYGDSGTVVVPQLHMADTEIGFNKSKGVFSIKNELVDAAMVVDVADVLFDNGVVHVVNNVPIPKTLEVSSEDLIRAAKRDYFIELLEVAGLAEVLDPNANYTMLIPPTRDLKRNNYTIHTDVKQLQQMLKLHLLPNDPIERMFDGLTVNTLANEELQVQEIDKQSNLFGLSPTSAQHGQHVLMYECGYSNGVISGGSTVVLLDRHISPKWIIPDRFGPNGGTYAILGLLFGVVLACVLILGLIWLISSPSKDSILTESGEYNDIPNEVDENSEVTRSEPIAAPDVSEDRAYGRHLNLP
ncbi:hypothetical protein DASB73_025680 [Starmerella bacillaris]|uniref:FAS1 domain-containing protein n=1 Tax=Starmerella bacillaris TaxID=1247836 RepID=A0AAV5RJI3_STABA|nr:hypothetical protein DASB73_025680 [Starmerella bacillaris]